MFDAFAVLAEPRRREILELLRDGESSVSELVDRLGASQPAVSKHLRVLRDGGFVSSRADGQRRLYRLDPTPLKELDAWLQPYRRRWAQSLDRLDDHLAQTRKEPT